MKTCIQIFALIIIILSITACNSPRYLTRQELLAKIGCNNLPESKDYPNDDAVVVYDKNEIDYFSNEYNGYSVRSNYTIKKLFKNFDENSKLKIPLSYDEEFIELNARVIKPDSSIYDLTNNDIVTATIKSGTDKDVSKIITVVFPKLEENCLIEYNYKIKGDFGYFGGNTLPIQSNLPKLYCEYKLKMPKYLDFYYFYITLPYQWNVYLNNIDGKADPEKIEDNYSGIAKWHFNNVPPFKIEPKMPDPSLYIARIETFLKFDSAWCKLGERYYNKFFKPNFIISEKVKQKSDLICKNAQTKIEKLDAIRKFVQDIRYEAIPFGQNGIKPLKPEEILDKEYGDCKNKTMLMIALLDVQGIDAYPILLKTINEGFTDPNKATMDFNHMIVYADLGDKNTYWIDPTVPFCKLGKLPWQDEGANVLLIKGGEDSKIVSSPSSTYLDNRITYDIKQKIQQDGKTEFDVKIKYYGAMDIKYRNMVYNMSFEESQKYVKSLLSSEFLNSEVDELAFSKTNDTDNPFEIMFKFKTDNTFNKQGNLYFVNFDVLDVLDDFSWMTDYDRKYPVFLKYPYSIEKNIMIEFPHDKFAINTMPENTKRLTDNFDYCKILVTTEGGDIHYNEKFGVIQPLIKKDKYSEAKDFISNIRKKMKDKIILSDVK